jgi:hypothetical protein
MDKDTIWQEIMKAAKYYNAVDRMSSEVLNVYVEHLLDMDYEVFKLAIDRHYATSKFMPLIADIRAAAMNNALHQAGVPTPAEAWGEVAKNLRKSKQVNVGTLTSVNRLDDHDWSHPLVRQAAEEIGWEDLYWLYKEGDTGAYNSSRARFQDAYREMVSGLKELYTLTPDLRNSIQPPDQPQLVAPEPESLSDNDRPEFGHNYFAEMPEKAKKKLDELRGKMEVK